MFRKKNIKSNKLSFDKIMWWIDFVMNISPNNDPMFIVQYVIICVLSALPHRSYIRAKLNQLFKR